jgi:hypothetical protein
MDPPEPAHTRPGGRPILGALRAEGAARVERRVVRRPEARENPGGGSGVGGGPRYRGLPLPELQRGNLLPQLAELLPEFVAALFRFVGSSFGGGSTR